MFIKTFESATLHDFIRNSLTHHLIKQDKNSRYIFSLFSYKHTQFFFSSKCLFKINEHSNGKQLKFNNSIQLKEGKTSTVYTPFRFLTR